MLSQTQNQQYKLIVVAPAAPRLLCGDCITLMLQMEPHSQQLIIVDPPFGKLTNQDSPEASRIATMDEMIPPDPMWAAIRHVLTPTGIVVMCGTDPYASILVVSNLKWFRPPGLVWAFRDPGQKLNATMFFNAGKRQLIANQYIKVFSPNNDVSPNEADDTQLVKVFSPMGKGRTFNPQMTPGKPYKNVRKDYGTGGEMLAAYKRDWTTDNKSGLRHPTTILEFARVMKRGKHPFEKPLALIEYLILTYSNEGDAVLDFCFGSGTSGVAAVRHTRQFTGIEKGQRMVRQRSPPHHGRMGRMAQRVQGRMVTANRNAV